MGEGTRLDGVGCVALCTIVTGRLDENHPCW